MNLFEELFTLQHIDTLIRTRATGCPKSLARRLDISECSVYRMIDKLKTQGLPIAYDKNRKTYYYREQVKWQVEFVVGAEKIISIKGGSNLNFSPKLSIFDSERAEICTVFHPYGAQ